MLKELEPLPFAPFFSYRMTLPFKRTLLQRPFQGLLLPLAGEKMSLVEVQDAFLFTWKLPEPFEKTVYPHYLTGDFIELWFNTRPDIPLSTIHQYCHRFIFLPEMPPFEATPFRTDETHPPASPQAFERTRPSANVIQCRIGKEALFGFEAKKRELGFALHGRAAARSVAFPYAKEEMNFERYPHLWGTLLREVS